MNKQIFNVVAPTLLCVFGFMVGNLNFVYLGLGILLVDFGVEWTIAFHSFNCSEGRYVRESTKEKSD